MIFKIPLNLAEWINRLWKEIASFSSFLAYFYIIHCVTSISARTPPFHIRVFLPSFHSKSSHFFFNLTHFICSITDLHSFFYLCWQDDLILMHENNDNIIRTYSTFCTVMPANRNLDSLPFPVIAHIFSHFFIFIDRSSFSHIISYTLTLMPSAHAFCLCTYIIHTRTRRLAQNIIYIFLALGQKKEAPATACQSENKRKKRRKCEHKNKRRSEQWECGGYWAREQNKESSKNLSNHFRMIGFLYRSITIFSVSILLFFTLLCLGKNYREMCPISTGTHVR